MDYFIANFLTRLAVAVIIAMPVIAAYAIFLRSAQKEDSQ